MGNFGFGDDALLSRGTRRLRLVAIATVALLVAATFVLIQPAAPAQAAGSPCGATINPIVCENQKPGTDPDVWDIDGAGDPSIQGFATDISVNAGQKIDFKIDTDASNYSIKIYRTGWYQGKGARFITSVPVSAPLPQNQPQCVSDVATDLYDCGTWKVSASWNVPADQVSGVYVALLERGDNGGASHIIFIVRNDSSTADVVFQTSDPTWHAYNVYGGASFYQGGSAGRAYKLSYNRPFSTRSWQNGRDFYFSSEYATVRFLERNGYDMTYMAGVDTDRRGALLTNHKTFLSVGHDEYWSGAQRSNIEAARDAGVNLQFLTGNEGYWRTRYEPSIDGSQTAYRTLVSYKETWANKKIDPSAEWTGTSRDPRFATPAQGGQKPENALTGTMYMINDGDLPVTVSSDEGKLRLWRGTSLASQAAGSKTALAPHTVGYESNEDVDNGHRPAGLIHLSTTTGAVPQYLVDYGNTVVPGSTVHHTTLYRAASGALVFSAASIQWGWGLDQTHDGDGAAADSRMQQAQVNLLADMGAQPGSLMSGLVAAAKSTDTTAPTTAITTPSAGQSIAHGTSVTITGTAADVGGRVAGVEVSTDGGSTWHAATGTTSWSYTYLQQGSGTVTLKARAIDDSANFATAGTSRQVTVAGPYTAFGALTPTLASADDQDPVELGLRFTPDVDGFVAGVRFYKGAANTGQHTGSLWDSAGAKLAGVVFGTETATGWQTAEFTTPVPVYAGQEYTVSYTATNGGYAMQARFWPYTSKTSPLTTSSAVGDAAAGVFGTAGTRPTSTWNESNYFVDAVFTKSDTSPLRIVSRTPGAGYSGVATSTDVRATFTRPADPATVSIAVSAGGQAVAGATTYDAATRTATFTPAQALAPNTQYTVTPTAADVAGVGLDPASGWTFTTQPVDLPVGECPCSLFPWSSVPSVTAAADPDSVTLGVKFIPTTAGTVTAVKFYKGPGNGGSHTGAIWSADGQRLATATFANESAQGWQTATLDVPVTVQPGVTYVASYVAPQGRYAVTAGRFSAPYSRGPLSVPASGAVYTYSGGFPSSSSSSDYGVDVVFALPTDMPTLVSRTPAVDAIGVPVGSTVSATFAQAIQPSVTGTVVADGVAVAGAWTVGGAQKTATFTPDAPFDAGAHVVVTLSGVRSTGGTLAPTVSWGFTVGGGTAAVSLLSTAAPSSMDSDTSSVELGMAFTSSEAGKVRAIRYYKPAGTTGTHTGSLWGPNGQRLAQVTFTGESASGWQRAVLATPVAIIPGAVYTVSYLAPSGRYAYTPQAFASPVVNGPLTAVSPDNGRYRYGNGGAAPTSSWNSSNYFADVEFVSDTAGPAVAVQSVAPAKDAVDVPTTADVRVTLVDDPGNRAVAVAIIGPDGPVAGTSTYDAGLRRITFDPDDRLKGATAYTVTVTSDGAAVDTWSLTTAAAVQTLFGTSTPQGTVADTDPVEVGTVFTVAEPGKVTALRFHKAANATGTHRGTLWGADGEVLAQVDFVDETASGWQRAALSTPVDVEPGVTYTVSYFAPGGRYSYTGGYFAQERTVGFITGPAIDNGRFLYGPDGGLPTTSFNATAYFVDAEIDFGGEPTPPPAPALTSFGPADGAAGVDPIATVVSASVSNAQTASLSVTQGGQPVAGSSSFDETTGSVVFTPGSPWERGKTYSVTVQANGQPLTGGAWSFSTKAPVSITGRTPASGATNVAPTGTTFSATLANASSASLALTVGGTPVAGTSSYVASTGVVTFTPSAALEWGKTYTAAVTGDGAAVGTSWSFSTLPVAALSARTPASGATNVDPATAKVTATLTGAVSASIAVTLAGAPVAGSSSWNGATGVVTFTPTAPLDWTKTYTATVSANGTAVPSGSWSFTTMAKQDQVSLFTTGTPSNANNNAVLAYQVGTRFRTSAPGVVTTIRYYKGNQNTGTHTGYLRSASGTVLAQVTFQNETASGWQTAVLSSPVRLTVNTEYRVTVHNASGRYAVTTGALASSVTAGVLSTVANGGVAGYGTGNPSTTNSNKYWVDVVFDPDN